MSTLTADRIRNHATKLGLTHLTETITQLVERAETAQMGYLDFVDLLLEEEVGLREGRRFRNALKLSGLPHHKTLDDFDFAFQPGLDVRKVRDLATLEFVPARSNIALLGPPGVGKTMLAVALAVAACQAGFSIYFTTLDDLVRRLRTAEATGRFNRQLQAYLLPSWSVTYADTATMPRRRAGWPGSRAGVGSGSSRGVGIVAGPVERLSWGRLPRDGGGQMPGTRRKPGLLGPYVEGYSAWLEPAGVYGADGAEHVEGVRPGRPLACRGGRGSPAAVGGIPGRVPGGSSAGGLSAASWSSWPGGAAGVFA